MKKYLSVFMLYVRGILYPCLGTMIGIGIAQVLFFWMDGLDQVNLEWAFIQGLNSTSIMVAIGMLAAQMCMAFSDKDGKMGNTMLRLRISEKHGFWMQVGANALVFTLYFLLQGLLFLIFCFWFDPGVTGLEILVTAYDNVYFHQFFPMHDIWQIVANVMMIVGLSIGCAAYPMRQRHGKYSITTFVMVLAVIFYLVLQREGDHLESGNAILLFCVTIYCITVCLAGTMTLEVDDND